MRLISAHFAWSPQNQFVRMPILEIDDNGVVVDFKSMGADFTEKQGIEFYNGLIIPGFVSSISVQTNLDLSFLQRLHRNGVVYALCDGNFNSLSDFANSPVRLVSFHQAGSVLIDDNKFLWETMHESVVRSGEIQADSWLMQNLYGKWVKSGLSIGGAFEKGKTPHVLQIDGMNWSSMTFTANTRLKVIV